ncbi:sensor histidine kinase [Pseudoduganella lutea]|uniref:Sensor histidine kinase n=1 Tax=Pseudoduganella lutea TaxID=321985 RepID=A0A4P6L6H3_9BURK|nr:sensor histidine kinase [Pseudoduganella lutea]
MASHRPPARLPFIARLNWYWICQAGGWLLVALFQAITYAGSRNLAPVVAWTLLSALCISDLWHRFIKARGWAARGLDWRLLAGAVFLLAPAMTLSVAIAIHLMMRPVDNVAWLPMALLWWAITFVAWNLCYVMALSLRRANRLEAETLRLELHAKDIELRALQAQVNPHFFFNSLNSVRALIYEEPGAAARMIDQLAGLMRYALQSGQAETVPLAAEMEAVEAYLAIEKIRFEERLRVHIDIEAGVECVMVPPMSLQTLVENAVKYGVELSTTGSDIRIRAWRGEACTVIEIANAGAIRGIGTSTQVGLANARKRLALAVGSAASLELAERDGWVCATLRLPAAA